MSDCTDKERALLDKILAYRESWNGYATNTEEWMPLLNAVLFERAVPPETREALVCVRLERRLLDDRERELWKDIPDNVSFKKALGEAIDTEVYRRINEGKK